MGLLKYSTEKEESGRWLPASFCSDWISSSELNNPSDCENVLQPCKHSCSTLSLHWSSAAALHLISEAKHSLHYLYIHIITEVSSCDRSYFIMMVFLCDFSSGISILAAEKTQAAGELCTCANLPHTCQEGQHAHSKQKLLYLSCTKTDVMLQMCTTTAAIYHNRNSQVNTVCSPERLDNNCECVFQGRVLFWCSHHVSQQLRGHRAGADRTDSSC